METFVTTLADFNTKLWRFHVPVPDEIAIKFINEGNKRILCRLNQGSKYHAAMIKSKAYWFILVSKSIKKTLNLTVGETLTVSIEKDESEFGHEVPEELQELLNQDEMGRNYFQTLSKGKQRSLVYLVSQVKNSTSRIKKSLAIMEHLKEAKGKLDFKGLNEKIKFYNNLIR